MATEYIAGQTMVLQWLPGTGGQAGGTINLAGDERSVTWSPSIETGQRCS